MTLVFSLQILTACVTEKRVEFDVFYSEKGYNNFTFNYIKPKEFIKKDSLLALLEKVSRETVYDCFIMQIYDDSDTLMNVKFDISDSLHIKVTSKESWKECYPDKKFIPEDHICRVGHPAKKCRKVQCKNWTYEEPVKCACWKLADGTTMEDFIKNYKISIRVIDLIKLSSVDQLNLVNIL